MVVLQSANSAQLEKISDLEQKLLSKDEDFAVRGKSFDAEAKRKVDSLGSALDAKVSSILYKVTNSINSGIRMLKL